MLILSDINVYEATVPDRMHHLDLGLFHYQIEYTRELLKKQHGRSLVDELDRRLAAIPRFSGIKIFANGLQSISRLTANEYRNLMKIMIFAVDNLYDANINNIENFTSNKNLVKVYESWNIMYMMSRYEMFKESDLEKFQVCILFFISSYKNIDCLFIHQNFRNQYMIGLEDSSKYFNMFPPPN
jgi:hypothetical protein